MSVSQYDTLYKLIGTRVNEILLNADKTKILFKTDKGDFAFYADGDCCSYSWIQHFDGVQNLLGEVVVDLDDKDLSNRPDEAPDEHDVLSIYGYEFKTAKGCATLDFRNDSNGYYGGSLEKVNSRTLADLKPISEDF